MTVYRLYQDDRQSLDIYSTPEKDEGDIVRHRGELILQWSRRGVLGNGETTGDSPGDVLTSDLLIAENGRYTETMLIRRTAVEMREIVVAILEAIEESES